MIKKRCSVIVNTSDKDREKNNALVWSHRENDKNFIKLEDIITPVSRGGRKQLRHSLRYIFSL